MTEDQIMESGESEVLQEPGGGVEVIERFKVLLAKNPSVVGMLMGKFADYIEDQWDKSNSNYSGEIAEQRAEERKDIEASLPPSREDMMEMERAYPGEDIMDVQEDIGRKHAVKTRQDLSAAPQMGSPEYLQWLRTEAIRKARGPQPEVLDEVESEEEAN